MREHCKFNGVVHISQVPRFGIFPKSASRLVPDGWVGPPKSSGRCHFWAFQLGLAILDTKNIGNGSVGAKLQPFEVGRISEKSGALSRFQPKSVVLCSWSASRLSSRHFLVHPQKCNPGLCIFFRPRRRFVWTLYLILDNLITIPTFQNQDFISFWRKKQFWSAFGASAGPQPSPKQGKTSKCYCFGLVLGRVGDPRRLQMLTKTVFPFKNL